MGSKNRRCTYCTSYFIASMMCFNESSVHVNESQGSVIVFLTLTNPSLTDVVTTVITTDGTAIGEAKIDV